jgi:hypothetical protein
LDLPELAVDAQLDTADREHFDPGFGFAGLDLVADPELPFPHSRDRRHRHRVFDASVIHGKSPPRLTHVNTIQLRIFRYHLEIYVRIARGFAASRREFDPAEAAIALKAVGVVSSHTGLTFTSENGFKKDVLGA